MREIDHFLQKSVQNDTVSFKDAYAYSWGVTKFVAYGPYAITAATAGALIVVASGIFMPFDSIGPFQRVLIATVATIIGSLIAFGLHFITQALHVKFNVSLWVIWVFSSIGCSIVFSLLVPEVVRVFFSYPPPYFLDLVVPMTVIFGMSNLFVLWRIKPYICRNRFKEQADPQNIVSTLPAHKRGKILWIAAADHYVEITTDRGCHMHRMTLNSAISKTSQADGLRVHRSHWVAYGAMLSLTKEGERYFLTLRTGAQVPVSSRIAPQVSAYLEGQHLLAAQ